jgi:hypothetical protein
MPLRKKHVRRILAGLLLAVVLVPLAALAIYGLRLRGGSYGREVAAELESRLRAAAQVTGARPTGPSTAVADEIVLVWTAAGGRLVLRLSDLRAESNVYGWYVRAARGRLVLDSPDPMETLAALNQRLVQPVGQTRLVSLVVEQLDVRLRAGSRVLRTEVEVAALSNMTAYTVTAYRPEAFKGPCRNEPLTASPLVSLRLNPASERGLFEFVKADFKGLPLGGRPNADEGLPGADFVAGTLDLDADWNAASPPPAAARVRAVFHNLDLAAWTGGAPGGPLTGAAALTLAYDRKMRSPGAGELLVSLEADGGRATPAFLEWAETLPAGLCAAKPPGSAAVVFDRLAVRCRIVGNRGWFEGPADLTGNVPLATSRLPGIGLPLVWASSEQFDAREVWLPLAKALGLEDEAQGATGGK